MSKAVLQPEYTRQARPCIENDILEDSSKLFGKHVQKGIKSLMEIWPASHLSTTLETEECSWDYTITHPYVYYHMYSDIASDVLSYTL